MNTDKEKSLYVPQDNYYKKLAEQAVTHGISVDLFLVVNSYVDISTVGILSILTGGETFHYPHFEYDRDGIRLYADFKRALTRPTGFNALMRIRTSNGLKVTDHYGNFATKDGTDIELASVDSDKAIGVAIKHDAKLDEKLDSSFQCALLYTTSTGQRRIRIHNLSVPNTTLLGNVFRYAEMDVTLNYIAKSAVSAALNLPLASVRDQLTEKCVKILASYRKNCASSTSPGQLILPESFKLFPLYTLALQKSKALRAGELSVDARVQLMRLIKSMGVASSVPFFYPRMLPLFNLDPDIGKIDEVTGRIKIPGAIRVSYERLDNAGVYLIENGVWMMLWVGRNVPQEFLQAVFGVDRIEAIDIRQRLLPTLPSPPSQQARAVINSVLIKYGKIMPLQIVRQGLDPHELEFMNWMVEDKNNDGLSYVDYLCHVHRLIQNEVKADSY